MAIRNETSWLRLALIPAIMLVGMTAAGCDTTPSLVGKWATDRTNLKGSPSEDDDLADLLSPSPKFAVQFTANGQCTSTWDEGGKEGSRTGTWKMVEDQGLKWRILLKMPPDEEEWEIKVGSPNSRTISLEATGGFKKGGPIFFKRS